MTVPVRMIDVQGELQEIDSHGVCHRGRPRFSTNSAHCGQ